MYLTGKTWPLSKPEPFDASNVMPSTATQTAMMGPKRTATTALLVALHAAIILAVWGPDGVWGNDDNNNKDQWRPSSSSSRHCGVMTITTKMTLWASLLLAGGKEEMRGKRVVQTMEMTMTETMMMDTTMMTRQRRRQMMTTIAATTKVMTMTTTTVIMTAMTTMATMMQWRRGRF
jgi:hypothetical protein